MYMCFVFFFSAFKRIPLDYRGPLICHLRLDLELQKRFPDIGIHVHSEYIELRGAAGNIPEAEKHLDFLLSSLVRENVSFRKPYIALLYQSEVERVMFNKLEKSDTRCHWKVNEDKLDSVYFCAMNMEVIHKAVQIFKDNIVTTSNIDSDLATELLLKFSGKCQKWVAGEEESSISLVYIRDIAEEVNTFLASALEKRKVELAELRHKAEIEQIVRESENMQAEGSEHSKITTASVGEAYTKQTGTGQSQHSSAKRSSAETYEPTAEAELETGKQTDIYDVGNFDQADKGSGSEETYAYSSIPMEHCLADFIMLQKDISEIQTKFNVRIASNCGKIVVLGGKKEETLEALKQIKALAEASYNDFILKTDPIDKDSDEWQVIEKEANVSNVAVSIRSIEHKPLRDKEHYKVGQVEICVGHGCIGDIKRVDMIVLPVNRSFFPITPASELFVRKGKNWNLRIFNSSVSVARQ